jgi:hypothetical protein
MAGAALFEVGSNSSEYNMGLATCGFETICCLLEALFGPISWDLHTLVSCAMKALDTVEALSLISPRLENCTSFAMYHNIECVEMSEMFSARCHPFRFSELFEELGTLDQLENGGWESSEYFTSKRSVG